ncbi:D-alanyl-D-alanine carboxypeptidase (penicillin-binding protein 5/6) [Pseudomonas psychrotolerans]|uniref:serine-type D-Ala-D-Ala carboxypeptidase n=1 Tax=Pseudomonas oryzihabitans TaxID=47885 RepID=A0AAJ2BNW2_9PSED|nr:D-alanyl-D-alanine carboxypeptidase (penicillin-binding protein 5/6) [Pseudomonas psychrotolerans]MDR6354033.1 D-alanyl-D-alanine carboxypeptidase (penicillin-binding protein 5/6) [Pseudomonas psychrotolerans]
MKRPFLSLGLAALGFALLGQVDAAPIADALIPSPPQLSAKAWVLLDATTGQVIAEEDSHAHLPPASLTKLMTVYVATRDIQAGRLKVDDQVTVSENAWRTQGSRMFLDPRSQVSVHDLLQGIVIDSGNDASVALAEHIAGSEESFASLMNATAQSLGLHDTHFVNPTGLPDPEHFSSPYDMALLARAIIQDESAYYELYAKKYFTWNGIRQPNRNLLLWRDHTVDGLKTGHTEAAGFCMVTSALRDGRRLITAVFGSTSLNNRAADTQKLLTYGFRFFENQTYDKAGVPLGTPAVWEAQTATLPVGVTQDLVLTHPKGQHAPQQRLVLNEPLVAPIAQGDVVGRLELVDGERVLQARPLVALADAEQGGWWSRWPQHLYRLVLQWLGRI